MSLKTFRLFVNRKDANPVKILSLEQARGMKAAGKAYFINSGQDMCLEKPRPEIPPEIEDGSMSNWRTIQESKLPINMQKRLGISCLHVTTKQFITPREPKEVQ